MHKTGVPYFIKMHLLQYYNLIDLHHLVCFSLKQRLLLYDFREKTNIFYTIYCEGTKNNPVNKEGGDTNDRKHSHMQVQGGSLALSGDDRKLSEGERYFGNNLAH